MVSKQKKVTLLYEDECYMVFDKPAGVLVIPSPKNEVNTLVSIVNSQYAKKASWKLHPCHRLDRDTSGVILFAKGKSNQKAMMKVFEQKNVHKEYIAIVQGRMKKKEGEFTKAIQALDTRKHARFQLPKKALTQYRVLQELEGCSVLAVVPLTGRTNQIRIHFSEKGHPLIGDRKYSVAKKWPVKFRRVALHASLLQWKDPQTNKKIKVEAPLPFDMASFISNTNKRR